MFIINYVSNKFDKLESDRSSYFDFNPFLFWLVWVSVSTLCYIIFLRMNFFRTSDKYFQMVSSTNAPG